MTPTQPWRAGFDEWDANHSNAVGLDAHQVAIEEAWQVCDARWRKVVEGHKCQLPCSADDPYRCGWSSSMNSDFKAAHAYQTCREAILEEVGRE